VSGIRPDIQLFNELVVQFPQGEGEKIGQVVPDNMVVLWAKPIKAELSYDLPLQPVGPFWVLDYVSKHNKRKDYEDNYRKYEQELRVPYYLTFYPEAQELTLSHLVKGKYVAVKPNDQGRYPIPELGMEVAILDGSVRFWLEGKLVPLAADLLREVEESKRHAAEASCRTDEAERHLALLRAEQERLRNP